MGKWWWEGSSDEGGCCACLYTFLSRRDAFFGINGFSFLDLSFLPVNLKYLKGLTEQCAGTAFKNVRINAPKRPYM